MVIVKPSDTSAVQVPSPAPGGEAPKPTNPIFNLFKKIFEAIGYFCGFVFRKIFCVKQPSVDMAKVQQVASTVLGITALPQSRLLSPTLVQTQVLDQRFEAHGDEKCGYHAFKNALVATAIANHAPDVTSSHFGSQELFKALYQAYAKHDPKEHDASIAVLTEIYVSLLRAPAKAPKEIQKMALHLQEDSITILDVQQGQFNWGALDQTSLFYLLNVLKVSKKEGPLTHAFVIGSQGHWVTIVTKKDADGSFTWLGCDSWGDQSSHIVRNVKLLEELLKAPDEAILKAYDAAVGEGNKRRVDRIAAGEVLNNDQYLFERIFECYAFMTQAGWLTSSNQEIVAHKQNLLILASHMATNAQFTDKIQPIVNELTQT